LYHPDPVVDGEAYELFVSLPNNSSNSSSSSNNSNNNKQLEVEPL